jgi:uncharacterized protein YggL (DUF469 family)
MEGKGFEMGEVVESTLIGAGSGLLSGGVCTCRVGSFNAVEQAAEELTERWAGICIGTVSNAIDAWWDVSEAW